MLLCSLTGMVLVSHGYVCRALVVSPLFRFGAVSALDSQFGFWSVCLEVPSFVEMIVSWSAISGCPFFAQRVSLSDVAGGGMDVDGSALAASIR